MRTSYPVRQYSKALHGLHSLLNATTVSMDTVLMAVLLMVHFEALRENFVPAIIHIEHGTRLLHSSNVSKARKIDQGLVHTLMRLEIQCSLYGDLRLQRPPSGGESIDDPLPAILQDLTQARDVVNIWTCHLFHFLHSEAYYHKHTCVSGVPLEKLAKSHELRRTFEEIDQLLDIFFHKNIAGLIARERHGLEVLRMRVKINMIMSATCLYTEETMFDAFLQDFEDILTTCTEIMASVDADRRLFSVSLDEGLLHPLFFTATQCRDSRIRHQAITQLKNLPSVEGTPKGIWHIEAMTREAEILIRLEEAECGEEVPCCSDIPEWRRVHRAGVDGWGLHPSKSKRQSASTTMGTRPNGMDGEWAEFSEDLGWSIIPAVE